MSNELLSRGYSDNSDPLPEWKKEALRIAFRAEPTRTEADLVRSDIQRIEFELGTGVEADLKEKLKEYIEKQIKHAGLMLDKSRELEYSVVFTSKLKQYETYRDAGDKGLAQLISDKLSSLTSHKFNGRVVVNEDNTEILAWQQYLAKIQESTNIE